MKFLGTFLLTTTLVCSLFVITSAKSPASLQRLFDLGYEESIDLENLNLGYESVFSEDELGRNILTEDDPPELFAESLNVTLIGKTMTSFLNRELYAFQGLRFAEKPERFKPPKELQPPYYDNDTYLANHLPVKCSQHGIFSPEIPTGSEDCLYLSVYIPYLPDNETNEFSHKLPVMIFFHGGAFIWGDSSLYMPTRLLDTDVILVVPHYRLGSFGFFSTMDDRAPGNIALYDQRMSMIWVQNHISSFGGDPEKVTIFGQSAGSASVNYHLIMPESGGLFRGVIGESGSAIEHWSLDPDPLDSARAIAEVNGCENTEDIDEIYDCMMSLDEDVITLGINTLSLQDRKNGLMGFRGAAPIIQNPDMDLSDYGTEPLVTKNPEDYYYDGDFNRDVSLMIGANKQEGSFIFAIMYVSYILPNDLLNTTLYVREQMIPDLLNSFGIQDKTHSLAESLAEHYLKEADRDDYDSVTPGMIDMSGMLFLKAGTLETAKLHSQFKDNDTNTFLYAFEYESDDTMFHWLFMGHVDELPFEGGVTHSDELMYIFSWPAIMEGDQVLIKDRLVTLWTNFAKYQNPTPDDEDNWKDLDIPKWPNFNTIDEDYMLMERDFTINQNYQKRWTITNDEVIGEVEGGGGGGGDETDSIEDDLDEAEKQRDAYLATMITFIVLFVAVCGVAGFFYYKWQY